MHPAHRRKALRLAEFDRLLTETVQAVTRPARDRLRLDLAFSPQNAARTADLAARRATAAPSSPSP